MASNKTTRVVGPVSHGDRASRWLDGVGFGGTVLVALLAIFWALVNFWETGWSSRGAIAVAIVTLLLSAMGYRQRAAWHARKSNKQHQGVPFGDESELE